MLTSTMVIGMFLIVAAYILIHIPMNQITATEQWKDSEPGRQRHFRKESADGVCEEDIPRSFVASVS